jgi:hypothetical protein
MSRKGVGFMGYEIVGAPWASHEDYPEWGALYPDLVQSGGLSPALQHIFEQLSASLAVTTGDWVGFGWAFVRKGSRKSQVCAALHKRFFSVEFHNRGFSYGKGWTSDLKEVARAIEIFLIQEGSTARMQSEFRWFGDQGGELILNSPADALVTRCWQSLERHLASEEEPGIIRQLAPLVSEAAKRPQLRQLKPFTSMHRLCFSRTTAFPWVQVDCIAWPIGNGRFLIKSLDDTRILGEGDAAQAADILVANLPPNCGPAIHGTAEEWEPEGK